MDPYQQILSLLKVNFVAKKEYVKISNKILGRMYGKCLQKKKRLAKELCQKSNVTHHSSINFFNFIDFLNPSLDWSELQVGSPIQ